MVEVADKETQARVGAMIREELQGLLDRVHAQCGMSGITIAACTLENLAADFCNIDRKTTAEYLRGLAMQCLAGSEKEEAAAFKRRATAFGELTTIYFAALQASLQEQAAAEPAPGETPAAEFARGEVKDPSTIPAGQVIRDRPGGKLMEPLPWCESLNVDVTQRLLSTGAPVAFSLAAFMDEEGRPRITCLAAHQDGVPSDAVRHLVECCAAGAQQYAEVGDPNKLPADKKGVN